MGLTLIHGNTQPNSKPRVFVVAEQSVFDALSSDLALDVYQECFDYDSFVKASLSKSISTNNAIVVLSDSLSQRVAPLEAVIALVRSNVILIPWKSTELEITTLNVAVTSPRPTANTLRRTIFQRVGLNEPPARFDGDDYIEEPPDARVVNLPAHTTQSNEVEIQTIDEITQEQIKDHTSSPLDWFTSPQHNQENQQNILPDSPTIERIYEQAPIAKEEHTQYLPKSEQRKIEEERLEQERQEQYDPYEDALFVTKDDEEQEESSFFLPDSFTQQETEQEIQAHNKQENQEQTHTSNIDSFWHSSSDQVAPEHPSVVPQKDPSNTTNQPPQVGVLNNTQQWLNDAFNHPEQEDTALTTQGSWQAQAPIDMSDTLDLDSYITSTSDEHAYNFEEPTQTHTPDVAFSPSDANGSQQMWTMFDTKIEPTGNTTQPTSGFPDGTDSRKAVSLYEPMTLCVYSPKGGVGKTSISVNLAARLAYTTRLQVCIVDLDIAFGNVGTRLGLYNPTVRELLNESHIDGESLARNLVYDRRSGLFALLAPLRPETGTNRRKFSPAAYKKILSLLRERFDVIILDCPVELRDPLVSGFALTEATQVVMVVNNEQATLLDARRAVEAMCRPKDSQRLPGLGLDPHSVGLVVNQKVDNVGREVDDIKAILGGGDPNHPSKEIEILSVIADDRELWVGNANMARTVATSGENNVDSLLDEIWTKILPSEASSDFESQQFSPKSDSPLDEIFSQGTQPKASKRRKRGIFRNKGEK